MHESARTALGDESADTLMNLLPREAEPLATKPFVADRIQLAESKLREEIAALRADLFAKISDQTRTVVFTFMGVWVATMGLIAAILAFT